MRRRTIAATAWALCWPAWAARAPRRKALPVREAPTRPYGRRRDVLAAAHAIAEVHGLDEAWVEAALTQARFNAAVAQLIMPAAAPFAKNWAGYRARFVEPRRIDAGVHWWHEHEPWLQLAEERFGVPAGIVVSVVGVETFYGRVTGAFRVLDALATLTFDFPTGRSDRSAFFRAELGHFLELSQRERWDPSAVMGSYAGAMGLPQFMPSSVLNYALDFDDDGRIDLLGSGADVVGSVARFLTEHGWRRDMPTHYPVEPPADIVERARLLVPDIVPTFSPAQMAERGAHLDDAALQHPGALALIELLNSDAAPTYVAGTQNFYALTRYNASSYYALAVAELARALEAAH